MHKPARRPGLGSWASTRHRRRASRMQQDTWCGAVSTWGGGRARMACNIARGCCDLPAYSVVLPAARSPSICRALLVAI
eukprot:600579-Pleurochrysis_carterae.AAC.1